MLIVFCAGAVSHLDTWDYKPELYKHHGKTPPNAPKVTFEGPIGKMAQPFWDFKPRGQSGKMISDLVPHLAGLADDMCFIHSLTAKNSAHTQAENFLSTGFTFEGYPSLGAWTTYALGTMNEDLPAFVAIADPRGRSQAGPNNWGNGFLPGSFQGTWINTKGDPIPNLKRVAGLSKEQQRAQLRFLNEMNQAHRERVDADRKLTARIKSFELAYRMQEEAPACVDVDSEPDHIKKLYGLENGQCSHFARQCLMARRMIERGVRYVQIYSGGMENQRSWDGHNDIMGNHTGFAGETDQPIAGLLHDLEERGLLDETLVIWGGEFGRLPVAQKSQKPGRDHNPHAGCYWFAGGGVKGGTSYGETDEIGHRAAVDKVEIHDLHATILHLLGLDHKKLTFKHSGRRFRLTDVAGRVINEIVA